MNLKVLTLTFSAMLASVPAFAVPTSIIVTGEWVTTSADENPFAPNGSRFRFDLTPYATVSSTTGWGVFYQYQAVTLGGSVIAFGSMGALDELTLTAGGNVSSVVINYIDPNTGIGGGAFYLYPNSGLADYQLFMLVSASGFATSYNLQETPEPGTLALVSSSALAVLLIRRNRRLTTKA